MTCEKQNQPKSNEFNKKTISDKKNQIGPNFFLTDIRSIYPFIYSCLLRRKQIISRELFTTEPSHSNHRLTEYCSSNQGGTLLPW